MLVAPVPLHFLYTIVLFMVVPGFQASVIASGVKWEKEQASKAGSRLASEHRREDESFGAVRIEPGSRKPQATTKSSSSTITLRFQILVLRKHSSHLGAKFLYNSIIFMKYIISIFLCKKETMQNVYILWWNKDQMNKMLQYFADAAAHYQMTVKYFWVLLTFLVSRVQFSFQLLIRIWQWLPIAPIHFFIWIFHIFIIHDKILKNRN